MRIALTGNPNSGKTTMFNALTGSNEKVGNWAGVTVEAKMHELKKGYYKGSEEIIIVDLPGAYSMSPFTSEESVTSKYVKEQTPDVIINIVDATTKVESNVIIIFCITLNSLVLHVYIIIKKHNTQCILGKQQSDGISNKYIVFTNHKVNPCTSKLGLLTVVGKAMNITNPTIIVINKLTIYL